jgi:hypothetical protein
MCFRLSWNNWNLPDHDRVGRPGWHFCCYLFKTGNRPANSAKAIQQPALKKLNYADLK